MSSLAADHFVLAECSAAAGGDEAGLLLHLHHQNHRQPEMYSHVPQHSRREKLRFATEGLSSSPSFFNNVNSYAPLAAAPTAEAATHFMNHNSEAAPTDSQITHHHCFSLSLSSPVTPPQAPRQQQQQLGIRPVHPLGPFTGYATVLSRSRFLNPAQDILEELCGVVSHVGVGRSGDHAVIAECGMPLDADLRWHGSSVGEAEHLNPSDGQQQSWRNNKLTCMLDEVYKRYKQYYQQVHDVIASFECVAGLSTAAPYASMALKLISKNFSNLKNMILDRLRHMNKVIGKCVVNELTDISGFDFAKDNNCHRRSTNNDRSFDQPQPWRPQRGLPESAVSVLRAWLFQHFLHPYPTDTDKQMLAKQTGLTRNQVSNWFINARVRLWKPMVEEVHSLESQQKHKAPTAAEHLNTDEECRRPPTKVTRTGRNHDVKCRSNQQEAFDMPNMVASPITMSFNDLSDHQDIGIGTSIDTTLGSSGVSLTLGLHQNRVVQFAEQLPVFDDCMDSYSLSINPEQGRSIGKSVSNHLFGDLVG